MIVVAIIGILASVAIPLYQDYTVNAKLTEAVSLSSAARLAIGEACSEQTLGSQAKDNASLGLPDPASISGSYTESVEAIGAVGSSVSSSGTVIVTLKTIGAGITAGEKLIYNGVCDNSGTHWDVTGTGSNIVKYLPKV